MTDAELAAALAETAGAILLQVRESGLLDGKALGKAGDKTACCFLMDAIRAQRPDDGVLCEETRDTGERLAHDRVWIIDPLDGTREYSERRADWAVHVALSINGEAKVGAVALPDKKLLLRTDQPLTQPTRADGPLRLLVSRTRPPEEALKVAQALGAELVPMGSAGAKGAAVVAGEADLYVHSGGQYEWDNCAPAAVALAAGLCATRLDGTPLTYNNQDVFSPDLLICRPDLFDRVQAALR